MGAPYGVTIDSGTGKVTWTPTTAGTYTFSVKVTDTAGLSDTKPVKVIVSSTPTARAGSNQSVTVPHDGNPATNTAPLHSRRLRVH